MHELRSSCKSVREFEVATRNSITETSRRNKSINILYTTKSIFLYNTRTPITLESVIFGGQTPCTAPGATTLTNTHSNSLTNTQSTSLPYTQSNSLPYTQSNTLTNTQSNTLTNTQSNTLTNTQSNTLTNTQTTSLPYTQSNTLTNTQSTSLPYTQSNNLTSAQSYSLQYTQPNSLTSAQPNNLQYTQYIPPHTHLHIPTQSIDLLHEISNNTNNKTRTNQNEEVHNNNNVYFEKLTAIMESQYKIVSNILKCVQISRATTSSKPDIFPISSKEEMDTFEDADNDTYATVVNYFHYIGGFNLKEAVNLCLKESLSDAFTAEITWWGREEAKISLYDTKLTKAIYDAMCRNPHIEKPQRSEFQRQMRTALKTAKERYRHRQRNQQRPAIGRPNQRRDLRNDDHAETEEEQDQESQDCF
ncbi:hypothetical protein PUN28_020907 [Cardiocondyla obscurior]|uniref:DUF4806 domain-containing protein n=2 Tax=Cardiocondyla obscurior TaxID=286306 RepID=A0AAW2E5K3_9HYME